MTAPTIERSFEIQFRDKTYRCDEISFNKSMLYKIHFPNAPLHITQAVAKSGETYWTSVPLDEKVKHIVQELGAIIVVIIERSNRG